MRYEEQDCSIFMVNSKRTRYGASNITGEGRRGYFMPPFLLDRGVMLGNTLEVVLRMVNDQGGNRNDQNLLHYWLLYLERWIELGVSGT